MDEGELLAALRAGDPVALVELFNRCQKNVRHYLTHRVPAAQLDDLTSDVYERAWKLFRHDKGAQTDLTAWLIGMAKMMLRERYRTPASVALVTDIPEPEPNIPGRMDESKVARLFQIVTAIVDRLGDGTRDVMRTHLELSRRDGKPVRGKQLARALGEHYKPNQVNRQLHRGRTTTRRTLAATMLVRATGATAMCALPQEMSALLSLHELANLATVTLTPDQAQKIWDHADDCTACQEYLSKSNSYAYYLLGLGLVPLLNDSSREAAVELVATECAPHLAAGDPGQAQTAISQLLADAPLANRPVHPFAELVKAHPQITAGLMSAIGTTAVVIALLSPLSPHHDAASADETPPLAATSTSGSVTAPAVPIPNASEVPSEPNSTPESAPKPPPSTRPTASALTSTNPTPPAPAPSPAGYRYTSPPAMTGEWRLDFVRQNFGGPWQGVNDVYTVAPARLSQSRCPGADPCFGGDGTNPWQHGDHVETNNITITPTLSGDHVLFTATEPSPYGGTQYYEGTADNDSTKPLVFTGTWRHQPSNGPLELATFTFTRTR